MACFDQLVRVQVLPHSVSEVVVPLLGDVGEDDVIIDLGSGTGKICIQLALQTPARLVRGIEFAKARCDVADAALAKLEALGDPAAVAAAQAAAARWDRRLFAQDDAAEADPSQCEGLAGKLRDARGRLSLECGDFLAADLSDVTCVFLNNAVFEPALMMVSRPGRVWGLECVRLLRRAEALGKAGVRLPTAAQGRVPAQAVLAPREALPGPRVPLLPVRPPPRLSEHHPDVVRGDDPVPVQRPQGGGSRHRPLCPRGALPADPSARLGVCAGGHPPDERARQMMIEWWLGSSRRYV